MAFISDTVFSPTLPDTITAGEVEYNSAMRHVFFVINFSLAVFLVVASVVCIGVMATPGSLLGGLLLLPLATLLAIAEWRIWYRHKKGNGLGWLYLILAVFVLFGIICNVGEALRMSWPDDGFGWFVAIGAAIACYFLFCGLYRVRSRCA